MEELLRKACQSAEELFSQDVSLTLKKQKLESILRTVLHPLKVFDDSTASFCSWLICFGKSFEDFITKLKTYDTSTVCGLVWNANFFAYRCRDCGISPCMSLCADCFAAGDHEGHDFNMFKSQAGGACDCGDENVMKPSGYAKFSDIKINSLRPKGCFHSPSLVHLASLLSYTAIVSTLVSTLYKERPWAWPEQTRTMFGLFYN